jgi:hypothetical protein
MMHDQEKLLCTDATIKVGHDTHEPAVPPTDVVEPTYPPQDGGKGAWMFLFGACIIEITAWGTYNLLSGLSNVLTFSRLPILLWRL